MRSAAMGQAGGGAGVIDEQLVAGTADPAHRAIRLPNEAAVIIGKLKEGRGVPFGTVGGMLLRQQY
jgi:hypothetical protein